MNGNPTLTVRAAWRDTTDAIGDAQHARWMVEVAAGLDPDEWAGGQDDPLTEPMVAHLDAMIARYRQGEPLQYVLGRWGFRHLDLAVDRRVLIPRPETELVAEIAIAKAAGFAPRRVLDLGTGSGAIGLAIATELPIDDTEVWITDISDDALDVARANLAGIGRAAVNVRVARGDWFDALLGTAAPERFDVIVSNPPYVIPGEADESVDAWEPAVALYDDDGLGAYRCIVGDAADHLVGGGWLVLEIGERQGRAVADLLTIAEFDRVEVLADLAGRDRIAVAQRRDR